MNCYVKKITVLFLAVFILHAISPVNIFSADGFEFGGGAGTEYDGIDLENNVDYREYSYEKHGGWAYSDVDNEALQNIVQFLDKSGIMGGYEDNTFKPNNAITRAEFSEVIMNCLNMNPDEFSNVQKGQFYDLTENDKHYNSISALVSMGIISGYSDNTFRPSEKLAYTEALAILLRAMGYTEYAQQSGGYPAGYLLAAKNTGLLNVLKPEQANMLTRSETAQLIYKGINAPLMKLVGVSATSKYSQDKDTTMLSEYHQIFKNTGTVKGTHVTAFSGGKLSSGSILIDNDIFNVDDSYFDAFFGYKVNYYYRETDYGNNIIYMSNHRSVQILTILVDEFVEYSDRVLTYESTDGKRKTADIDAAYAVIQNGKHIAPQKLEDVFDFCEGAVTLVSNEDDGSYELVFVNKYENIVIDAISSDGVNISIIPKYNITNIDVKIAEGTVFELVGPDGNPFKYQVVIEGAFDENGNPIRRIDLSAVPRDSVMSIFADDYKQHRGYSIPGDNAQYIKAVISDKKVTGTVESMDVSRGTVEIGGKEFEISASNFLNENESRFDIGDSGTFYLDINGKIAAYKKNESKDSDFQYGYLITADLSKGLSPQLSLKIMGYNGNISVSNCGKTLIVNDTKKTAEQAFDTLQETAAMLRENFTISQLIKYKLNSESIVTELQTVLQPLGVPNGVDPYSRLRRDALPGAYTVVVDSRGRLKEGSSGTGSDFGHYLKPAKYFSVPSTETFDEDDYYVDRDAASYVGITLEIYDTRMDLTPEIAIEYLDSSGSERKIITTKFALPVMIKKVFSKLDKDGDPRTAVTVVTGLAEKTYYGENDNTFKDCKPGQMVWLYTKKTDDTVSSCDVIKFNDVPITPDTIADVNIWQTGADRINGFGEVYFVSGNNVVLQAGPVIDSFGKREVLVTGYLDSNIAWQQGGAILYDATNSKTNPEIRLATISDFKSVYKDGASNASKVYWVAAHGASRQYIIYNGLE